MSFDVKRNWLSILTLFITAANIFCLIWYFSFESSVYYLSVSTIPRCFVWWVNIIQFSRGIKWKFPFWKWFKFEGLTFDMLSSCMFYYLIQDQEYKAGKLSYDQLCTATAAFCCLMLTQMCMVKLLTMGPVCRDTVLLRWYKYGYNFALLIYLLFTFITILNAKSSGVLSSITQFIFYINATFAFYAKASGLCARSIKQLQMERETAGKNAKMRDLLNWYDDHIVGSQGGAPSFNARPRQQNDRADLEADSSED